MPALGMSQKPMVMPSYPHMLTEDTEVWSRYLRDPIAPIREVWYDVHVGKPMEVVEGASQIQTSVAAAVSRKRIDVIARVGAGLWCIEIKPLGSMLALGQVLSYTRLFVAEYQPFCEVWPVVVCYSVDLDLADEFEAFGVAVIEVGMPDVT